MATTKLSDLLADEAALYNFDATPEEVAQVMRTRQTAPRQEHGVVDNVIRRLAAGISFGLADEGSAAVTAGVDSMGDWWNNRPIEYGKHYDAALELERATDDAFL